MRVIRAIQHSRVTFWPGRSRSLIESSMSTSTAANPSRRIEGRESAHDLRALVLAKASTHTQLRVDGG